MGSNLNYQEQHIWISLCVGAYGPTIRIDTQNLTDLQTIEQLFKSVIHAQIPEIELGEATAAKMDAVGAIVLAIASSEDQLDKRFVRVSSQQEKLPHYRWVDSVEGWKRCAGLVAGLIEHGQPGHQYLTREGVDDALVELAFGEYRPPNG